LTTEEQQNIDAVVADTDPDNSITVSEAHAAMEYYRFANSANDFLELSTAALVRLYFIKVQNKPAEYERMNIDEKRTWDLSSMKKIRKIPRNKLKGALEEAVRALLSVCGPVN